MDRYPPPASTASVLIHIGFQSSSNPVDDGLLEPASQRCAWTEARDSWILQTVGRLSSNASRWAPFRGLCIEGAYYLIHPACNPERVVRG
jgi:hypothetical protein